MKSTKLAVALLVAMGLSAVVTPAMAYEAGDWLIRGRVVNVNPDDSSGKISSTATGTIPGSGVKVNDDTIPELDITYMIAPHWGMELILGYSEHDVRGTGSTKSLGKVINAKALPPTLTLQYHFAPNSDYRPYVGAGVNYTHFFEEDVKGPVLNVPGAKVKMDDSWGLAVQAGIDIAINEDWFVNMDVKYIDMSTTAHFKGTPVGKAKVNVDVDPVLWGIGVGRRF